MKNPLNKRLPRELAKDATKYIAIFIMMVLLISICSGMRVGNESLKKRIMTALSFITLRTVMLPLTSLFPKSCGIHLKAILT